MSKERTRAIRIAILDSGINVGHFAIGEDVKVKEGWKAEFPTYDDKMGHGTACAYIIQKLSPQAELYNVKIFDRYI